MRGLKLQVSCDIDGSLRVTLAGSLSDKESRTMINGELEFGRRAPSRRGFLAMAMVGVSGVLAACGGEEAKPAAEAPKAPAAGAAAPTAAAAATKAPAAAPTTAPAAKQVEIHTNFRQGGDAEWQARLMPKFMEKNPNIKVVLDTLPAEPEYWAKVAALFATGQAGDFIWASNGNFLGYAENGVPRELDSIISKDKYDLGDYTKVGLDNMRYQGKVFGMPWGSHCQNCLVMYNEDLLKEAGVTIEQAVASYDALYEAAKKATKGAAGSRTQFGFLPAGGQTALNCNLRAFGGETYDAAGKKLLMNDPAAIEAIKWTQKMWKDTAPVFGSGFNGDELFATGKIAMVQAGYPNHFVPGDKAIAGKFKWGITLMPKGPKGIVGTQFTVNGITINSASKQPDATWEYMKFMMDPVTQEEIVLNNGGRPAARKAVLDNPKIMSTVTSHKAMRPLYDTALGWPSPANSRWPEFTTALDQVMGPIWTGAIELDPGMKAATTKLQEILDKPKS